jgi:CRP/FNR family transcriptional regulator, cyclic AMP receptor protein
VAAGASLSFVEQLSDVARKDLEALGTSRRFTRGAVLFREEDDGSRVMVLQFGRVKVSVSAPSGREVILHVFDAGALLGELSAVDGGARSATVTALTDVDVLVLSQLDFKEYLDRHSEASRALLELVVAKLRGATRRQLEFGTGDALGRLCRTLVELGGRYGDPTAEVCRFELPVTQQDLASLAGLSREAVVKGLAALRALEWIRTSGRTVELIDQAAVAARAEQS